MKQLKENTNFVSNLTANLNCGLELPVRISVLPKSFFSSLRIYEEISVTSQEIIVSSFHFGFEQCGFEFLSGLYISIFLN